MELEADSTAQLDKEQFIAAVADEVKYYGLQSFFSMPKEDGTIVSLLKKSHAFTVEETIAEYEDRLNEPEKVLDDNGQYLKIGTSIQTLVGTFVFRVD